MKKGLSITIITTIFMAIIFVSSYFIIIPNVKKLNEVNNIKELTNEEKTSLINDIKKKYDNLENGIDEKYATSTKEVETKYDNLENQINEKYNTQISNIETSINNKEHEQTNEFFKNQFSQKYYDLKSEISNLRSQQNDLRIKKNDEIFDNTQKEQQELREIETDKLKEKNSLNEKEESEISNINTQNSDNSSIKTKSIIMIVLGGIIILIPILYIVVEFNSLTVLSNAVKKSWSQVDVLLKQRADLIPNIVKTIKGYSNHEKDTLTSVVSARNEVLNANTKEDEINANKKLNNGITKLLALQEAYPELKANENYMSLHDNLRSLEDEIAETRKIYNENVLNYQNKLEIFPTNMFASLFNFKPELFFKIDEEDKENPTVEL